MRAFTLSDKRNLIFYFGKKEFRQKDDDFSDLEQTQEQLTSDDMFSYSNPVEYNKKLFILGQDYVNVISEEGDSYSYNLGVSKVK